MKLARAGVIQQDVIDILAANSRVPQSNFGDLNGQINALDLGEKRLHALLDDYGDAAIEAALAALWARADTLMRANIAALPDGAFSCDDFLDNDGITDRPLRISLDLTITGDRMTLDFSLCTALRRAAQHFARDRGCQLLCGAQTSVHQRAVQWWLPGVDRFHHSRHDAARRIGAAPGSRLYGNHSSRHRHDLGTFAKVAPERANGSPFATINALSLSGWRAQRRRWIMFCFFGGGLGGNPEGDGLNHANNPISTATIPPVEILESLDPVMFTQWALRPDFAGPGRHRGGLGAIYEIEVLAEDGADVFLIGERGKYPPFGVNGGGPAALNRFAYDTDGGEATPALVSKVADVKIRHGRKVRLETPGGGGFGDPATRDSAGVAHDVRLGYVTREAARRDYKVVLRDDGSPDAAATAQARAWPWRGTACVT